MSFFPRLRFRRNSGATYTEPRVNFVEGTGIGITLTDVPDDEIQVEIAASGSGPHDILDATHTDTDDTDVPADGDVLTWDDYLGLWTAAAPTGGGGGAALAADIATRTSGAPTLNSTSWANVDTGLDLVLAAEAGDIIVVGIATTWQNESVVARLDVGTLVSGSIVNYFGGATDPSSGYGVPSWFGNSGTYDIIGSPTARALVAGDISGGNVTLRLRYKTDTAANKTMNATADAPLVFWAVNLGSGTGGGNHDILSDTHGDSDSGDTPSEGDVLTFLSGAWAAEPPSGGGSLLPLDISPGSPSAYDDEFDDASFDTGLWTVECGGNNVTPAEADDFVVVEFATSSKRVFGIQQPSPSGSFSVSTKFAAGAPWGDVRAGCFVGIAGGKGHVCGPFPQDGALGFIGITTINDASDWSGYDGVLTTLTGHPYGPIVWSKIVWDTGTSTLSFYASMNGIFWYSIGTRTGMSQPDRMGLCVYFNSSGGAVGQKFAADWFRVTEP